jgi:hypothetical protein
VEQIIDMSRFIDRRLGRLGVADHEVDPDPCEEIAFVVNLLSEVWLGGGFIEGGCKLCKLALGQRIL